MTTTTTAKTHPPTGEPALIPTFILGYPPELRSCFIEALEAEPSNPYAIQDYTTFEEVYFDLEAQTSEACLFIFDWPDNPDKAFQLLSFLEATSILYSDRLTTEKIFQACHYLTAHLDANMASPGEVIQILLKEQKESKNITYILPPNELGGWRRYPVLDTRPPDWSCPYTRPNTVIDCPHSAVAHLPGKLTPGKPLAHPEVFGDIITQDLSMLEIFRYIEAISITKKCVFITGETGTGKELIARAVHKSSGIRGEMVCVNISGFDDTMFSEVIFGYMKGSCGGSINDNQGLIKKADGGTLFLDGIGDLTMRSQRKLLRLLDKKEYYVMGDNNVQTHNARIIVATNRSRTDIINPAIFRQDLFYRLAVHTVELPPLRERKGDLLLLIDHFVRTSAAKLKRKVPTVHSGLYSLLNTYSYPGNIRELESLIFNGVAANRKKFLTAQHFQNLFCPAKTEGSGEFEGFVKSLMVLPTCGQSNLALLLESCSRTLGNKAVAAHLVGITPQALNNHDDLDESKADQITMNFKKRLASVQILPTTRQMKSILIKEALQRSKGNKMVAAHLLGITPQALSKRLHSEKVSE